MSGIDERFVKVWRKKYRWPLCRTPHESEEKIAELEGLVKGGVTKEVLSKIVDWKTSGRSTSLFEENSDNDVQKIVKEVCNLLEKNPNGVSECIRLFSHPNLLGVRIAVASAFLRFLDPVNHKYGIVDKNVAKFLNNEGITNFNLRKEDGYIKWGEKNIGEYQKYHNWLQRKSSEIKFAPVDIEMAIFAYTTQEGSGRR